VMNKYDLIAELYDPFYSNLSYERESRAVVALAERRGIRAGARLLDLGCGTGRHLSYLTRKYDCTGIDSSQAMLRIARRNAPTARFLMGSITQPQKLGDFAIVVTLRGVLLYIHSGGPLRAFFAASHEMLAPGGLLIADPWLVRDSIRLPEFQIRCVGREFGAATGDQEIARLTRNVRNGARLERTYHYLIGRKGRPTRHLIDTHTMRLHRRNEIEGAVLAAGFERANWITFGERKALLATKSHSRI
jgi:SAM-dependent methyltransferase